MSELENHTISQPLPARYRLQHILGSLIGRRFDHLLDGIQHGQLSMTWPDGHTTLHGKMSADPSQNAQVTLHNFRPVRQMMLLGENGFAESYLCGDWVTDNLRNLFALIMNNEAEVAAMTTGSWYARLINSVRHARNHNSLIGSQRNIEFHYDLGNEFYQLWLDPTMSYSSAVFTGEESLESAQTAKLDMAVRSLDPKPGARVLEIGCGWGAMANRLATQAGCQVEGISLSHEQLRYAQIHNNVIANEQSPGSTEFRHQDYRAVEGTYDHIVSIEMFEAVGEQYWVTYFDKLSELLETGGSAVLQVITIAEDRFEEYRSSPDFIQRYIFPGGMLPTKTHLEKLVEGAGFELVGTDWFGISYAETLARWRERFDQVTREVGVLGFDDRFLRMWRYYLDYCETGFRFGRTDVGQLLLRKR
ncbi:SAM-dependent methyltransferase [Granulosicoccus antarcticus]|uniref:Tuberculostearic acid methyltransferase UfaA1 n=1 Tax=Granulosicoccus antarcticus IMCC3135 TaxID=1192854 RepID=A0A2Z2NPX2_9GAMM|nr:cyclopropane-fatty-acyl-phospholipid synthase family protein [Granulosicoccus antarcticus]ASJ71708.1 Tuberculostearic acid methyltransferase UfaA1 [Granulosicoccus antarcticus IMCC3135]